MSKSIYEETFTHLDELVDVLANIEGSFLYRHYLDNIRLKLKKAQKQEKLLEMYRQLSQDLGLIIEHDTTDEWTGHVDYEYLEINEDIPKALNTYKQIKELEND